MAIEFELLLLNRKSFSYSTNDDTGCEVAVARTLPLIRETIEIYLILGRLFPRSRASWTRWSSELRGRSGICQIRRTVTSGASIMSWSCVDRGDYLF